MIPRFSWKGIPAHLGIFFNSKRQSGGDSEAKRFISTGDKEAETNCRGCGYNTTDEERKAYGRFNKDDEGSIIKQYHTCVFCSDDATQPPFKFFDFLLNIDKKIHLAKIRLRFKFLKSLKYTYLSTVRQVLVDDNYEEIFHAHYKEDDSGIKILNEYERQYEKIEKERSDIFNAPRHLYLESLEEFGGASDEPPCTRNLTKKQKKKLLKNLKEKLKECQA